MGGTCSTGDLEGVEACLVAAASFPPGSQVLEAGMFVPLTVTHTCVCVCVCVVNNHITSLVRGWGEP